MENTNEMQIIFDSYSSNESFARVAVAAFMTSLNRRGRVPRPDGGHRGLCRQPRADLRRAHGHGLCVRAAGRRVLSLPQVTGAGRPGVLPPRDGL